jgi:protein arginine kinase activator
MQKCSACGKAAPSIHVMVLDGWDIEREDLLCDACAVAAGHVHGPAVSADVLSGLVSMGKLVDVSRRKPQPGTVCPGCRMSAADFRQTGRFGCPRCYEVFRESLLPVLNKVHDASTHRGRFPGPVSREARRPVDLVEIRRRLADAIARENYEEAARLRDELHRAGAREETGG